MKIVIALGGNALTSPKEKVTYETLVRNIERAGESIAKILKKKNTEMVIVFGSGPQIGALILQNEIAKNTVTPMPLDVLDAELQGELGYLIAQSLGNIMSKHMIKKQVISILTQVIVNKNDAAFANPTKPVGAFYSKKEAEKLEEKGLVMREEKGKGYRRVVPSPKPIKIVEADTIKKLVESGIIVVAAGGGGIPVFCKNKLHGIDAVIDKDLASACLAKSVSADALLILTDIDGVYLDYKKPGQKKLARIKASKLKEYMMQGQFPAGSMGPKVQACLDFVESDKMAVITSPENAVRALRGKAGTMVTK